MNLIKEDQLEKYVNEIQKCMKGYTVLTSKTVYIALYNILNNDIKIIGPDTYDNKKDMIIQGLPKQEDIVEHGISTMGKKHAFILISVYNESDSHNIGFIMTPHDKDLCVECNAVAGKLCKCGNVKYCNEICQKKHWKYHKHIHNI